MQLILYLIQAHFITIKQIYNLKGSYITRSRAHCSNFDLQKTVAFFNRNDVKSFAIT